MLKKTLVSVVTSMGLLSSIASAQTNELKVGMDTLAKNMTLLERGILTNDSKKTLSAAGMLRDTIDKYMGNTSTITKLLPEAVKYKASIAINSAHMIEKEILEIETVLSNKKLPMIKQQMKTQESYLNIQRQCFRCHNLVRDWQ